MSTDAFRHGGRVGTTLLALLGLGWSLLCLWAVGRYAGPQASVILFIPAALSFLAAAAWWRHRRWAPLAALVALIATVTVVTLIYLASLVLI